MILSSDGVASPSALVNVLNLNPTKATRLSGNLLEKNVIDRQIDFQDWRKQSLSLTNDGLHFLRRILPVIHKI